MILMRKVLIKAGFVFFVVFCTQLAVPHVYAEDTCVECHKDPIFMIKNKKIFDYFKYWKDSVHDIAKVKCTDCHGGKSNKTDKDAAHKDNFLTFKADDKKSLGEIPIVCGRCHSEILKNFLSSKHYRAINKRETSNCVTCHGSMNTGVYEAHNVAEACRVCHNEKEKNTPEVSEQAEKILTYINYIRSYYKWLTINYADENPELVKELEVKYRDIEYSWHQFNFEKVDEKTMALLNKVKTIVNKELAEKKKQKK